jgi:LemA protein
MIYWYNYINNKNKKGMGYMGLIIVIVVILLLVVFVVSQYNGLVKSRNKVKNNWSQIDVQLKKRADLIPNLVETVKGYANHEKSTLEAVMNARNSYVHANGFNDKVEATQNMNSALSRLFALSESYPDLKANSNFKELQKELTEVEDKIAFARQFYNDAVYSYMNQIQMFPSNIIASIFNFEEYSYFEVEEKDKENVKVEF